MIRACIFFLVLFISLSAIAGERIVTDEVLMITADELGHIYFSDTLYADSLFKNQRFVVEGTVVRVKKSYVYGCLVELAIGNYREQKVDCFFTMDDFNDLYRIHKGLKVRIKGICEGRQGRGVNFQSCSVAHFDVPRHTPEQKFQSDQQEFYDHLLQDNLRYFEFDP